MSLISENYNCFEFLHCYSTKYMSEDNILKTLMSDAERKRLRSENETPEERTIRQEKLREGQR